MKIKPDLLSRLAIHSVTIIYRAVIGASLLHNEINVSAQLFTILF